MTYLDIPDIIAGVEIKSHVMTSAEADFERNLWSFTAPHWQASAGEHVIIHKKDWDAFVKELLGTRPAVSAPGGYST